MNELHRSVFPSVLLAQSQALKCVQKVLLSKDKVRWGEGGHSQDSRLLCAVCSCPVQALLLTLFLPLLLMLSKWHDALSP